MTQFLFALLLCFFFHVNKTLAQSADLQQNKGKVDCENWGQQDWDKFISNDLLKQNSSADSVVTLLWQISNQCKSSFEKNQIGLCTSRIDGYYRQFGTLIGISPLTMGTYSAIMTDEKYLASLPKEAAELPDELNGVTNGLPKNWRDLALKNGWKYALFHSDTGNSARLILHIPGKKYDRLLVYYTFDSKNTDPSNYQGVQLQAIQKTNNPDTAPKYYFNSFNFIGHNKTPKQNLFGGRCIMCHSSGPRAIVPQKNPNFKTEVGGVANLEEFNNLIVQKNPPDLSTYYDIKNFPTHLKVGKQCAECHNGKDRSSLAASVSTSGYFFTSELHRKVVTEESMPREFYESVSTEDRTKMIANIGAEYSQMIKNWLTETKCYTGGSNDSNPSAAQPSVDNKSKSNKPHVN